MHTLLDTVYDKFLLFKRSCKFGICYESSSFLVCVNNSLSVCPRDECVYLCTEQRREIWSQVVTQDTMWRRMLMLKCEMTESGQSRCILTGSMMKTKINRKAVIPAWFKNGFEMCNMSAKCVHNSLTEMPYHQWLPFIKHPFVVVTKWMSLSVKCRKPINSWKNI